ncbi:MAG TPA: hypothetical protein VER39_00855 [Nocardioidaceae bacterium]|nr:hypothetical protein [Nocardioidaceae bacterium]
MEAVDTLRPRASGNALVREARELVETEPPPRATCWSLVERRSPVR